MELQKLKGGEDVNQTKGQTPNPTLENMKEAAYSIYEHYLSEKVKSYCDRIGPLQGKRLCYRTGRQCATLGYVTEQGDSVQHLVMLQNGETVCNTWLCYRTGRQCATLGYVTEQGDSVQHLVMLRNREIVCNTWLYYRMGRQCATLGYVTEQGDSVQHLVILQNG